MFQTFSPAINSPRAVSSVVTGRRTKRHQVARACVWCRTYRIKCDSSYPCRNCRLKERECTTEYGKEEIRTFSSAMREIDRLQERVRELEGKLKDLDLNPGTPDDSQLPKTEPQVKIERDALPEAFDPLAQHGANRNYYNWSLALREAKPGSSQIYGSSSMFYFMDRLCLYVNAASPQPPYSPGLEGSPPVLASCLHVSFTSFSLSFNPSQRGEENLSIIEQKRLLHLYWEYVHGLHPILEADLFDCEFDSLLNPSYSSRDLSALLDIILAVCMQLDVLFSASKSDTPLNFKTDSPSGQWFYRRCQHSLQEQLEDPSIITFQCYYLSILWLSRASLYNAAHSALAAGLRIGVILGLHLEPSSDLPTPLREFRKRIWWMMYSLEAQYAMDFGRPLAVNFGQVSCTLPEHTTLQAAENKQLSISFNAQYVRLILASRSVYILFHRECAKVLREHHISDLYQSAEGLEACATWLDIKKSYLDTWACQVPDDLKVKRENGTWSYSTEQLRPTALHPHVKALPLQCMLLELAYHMSAMNMYRPFIAFPGKTSGPSSGTKRHAISCAKHAMVIINIINQAFVATLATSVLPEMSSQIWNATLSLLGYLVAYPNASLFGVAQESVIMAISCLVTLSQTLVTARTILPELRKFIGKVELLIGDIGLERSLSEGEENHSMRVFVDVNAHEDHNYQNEATLSTSTVFCSTLDIMHGAKDVLTTDEWLDQLLDFDSNIYE